jgi:hypothetical protein
MKRVLEEALRANISFQVSSRGCEERTNLLREWLEELVLEEISADALAGIDDSDLEKSNVG